MAELIRGLMQRIPRGLLAFLDVKTGGTYPTALGGMLQPVLDLQAWYASEATHYLGTNAGQGTTAGNATFPIVLTTPTNIVVGGKLQVPQTETWLVTNWSVFNESAGVVATDYIDVVPVLRDPAITYNVCPPTTLDGAIAFGQTAWSMRRSIRAPILVPPGWDLAFRVNRLLLGANKAFFADLRILRLPL